MQDYSRDYLQILGQLAQEYQQKFVELEQLCQNSQPELVIQQLKARGELTTDHFRAAQQALIALLGKNEPRESEDFLRAATVISRCFDEMRILFTVLLDFTSNPSK